LGIAKNALLFFGKSGDKRGLNSLNTLAPNIFLKVSGDLRFGEDYPYYSHENSSTKQGLICNGESGV
jgi:hypothetical protein